MTVSKKAQRSRRGSASRSHGNGSTTPVPLRAHAEEALNEYFGALNGHRPARLYQLVMREVELPLFRSVMQYAEGNQSRAATILGINRGTLRKKLLDYGLSE